MFEFNQFLSQRVVLNTELGGPLAIFWSFERIGQNLLFERTAKLNSSKHHWRYLEEYVLFLIKKNVNRHTFGQDMVV